MNLFLNWTKKQPEKSFITLILPNKRTTQGISKNFKARFGNFVLTMLDFKSDCLHFGTSQTTKKRWLLQLTVLSRKWIKYKETKLYELSESETNTSIID